MRALLGRRRAIFQRPLPLTSNESEVLSEVSNFNEEEEIEIMRSRSYLRTAVLAVAAFMGLILVAALPERATADSVMAEAALGHLMGKINDSHCDCLSSSQTHASGGSNARVSTDSKKLQSSVLQRIGQTKASHYDVQSGDTLDGIIKGQLSDNPVHKDILRQAIVLANPKAFRRNNPHWLYANRKIKLPEVADIHRAVFKQSAIQDELLGRIESKKYWVRYP